MGLFTLLLALAVFIFCTFRRVGVIPASLIASLVVLIGTGGVDIWTGFVETYCGGFGGAFTTYFPIIAATALYSKCLEMSGSATKIAYQIMDWVGEKNVLPACCVASAVLCYGGVNGIAVSMLLVPIMLPLFREANIHRRFMLCCIWFGNANFTAAYLPAATSLSNVLPAQALGTSLNAAPVMGIISSIAIIVMYLWWINFRLKRSKAKGEGFTPIPGATEVKIAKNNPDLPPAWAAFLPIIFVVGAVIVGSRLVENTTLLAVVATLIGTIICVVLNFRRLLKNDVKTFTAQAFSECLLIIGNLAAVTGMAGVLRLSPSYTAMVDAILNSHMNVYVKGALAASAGSFMAGSSMAGLRIVFESVGNYFVTSGANLAILHRVMAMISMAASGFPNCAGHYVQLRLTGLDYSEAWRDTLMMIVVMGGIVSLVCLGIAVVFY